MATAPGLPELRSVRAGADAGTVRRVWSDDPASAAPDAVRTAAGRIGRGLGAGRHTVSVEGLTGPALTAAVEGLLLGTYRWTLRSEPSPRPSRLDLAGAQDDDAVALGRDRALATAWARDLTNTRSDVKTPAWLGTQATRTLDPLGVAVTVRDEGWLAEQGFGGVLAVGGGSAAPPRLIEASWAPRGARKGVHLVLVGKGITFDTGGINRKAGAGMTTMYTDMAGGAAVLGAVRLLATRQVPVRVTALVPAAENAFGGGSYRPGDVVRHHGGRTSEIMNTDAEGRLVLGDAIAYAAGTLKPTAIVDIATLTGAMKVSLGLRTGGLFASGDHLADGLLQAGADAGEPLWRLPMPDDYASALDSPVADATNAPGNPGGITAAMFLRPFARGVDWAHLDIAGPARSGKDDAEFTKGATGFGARLLAGWAASLA